jgi:hypothetical protein
MNPDLSFVHEKLKHRMVKCFCRYQDIFQRRTKVNMCWVNTNEKMFCFCCHGWNNEFVCTKHIYGMQKTEKSTKVNMCWVNTNEKMFWFCCHGWNNEFVCTKHIYGMQKTENRTKVNMCWVNTNEKMFWFCCHGWDNECFWCLMIWRNLKNVLWQLNLPGLPTPGLGEKYSVKSIPFFTFLTREKIL